MIVSADGTEIISGSADDTLRRWSVPTGQCLQVYRGHNEWIRCVAQLSNGNVISGSNDKSMKIWNRLTGVCLHTLVGHTDWIFGITVCPNGDIVSASGDCSLRVWRVGHNASDSYICRQVLANAHSGPTLCITTVPGTDDLISGGGFGDKEVKLWRRADPTADYSCIRTFAGHTDDIWSVAVMDNVYIVSGSADETIKIWCLATGECVKTLQGHNDVVIVFPDNEIVSASYDHTLKIWH